jgi:hypothetical protein
MLFEKFALQLGEERLDDGVVKGVAGCFHGFHKPGLTAILTEHSRAILVPEMRMNSCGLMVTLETNSTQTILS